MDASAPNVVATLFLKQVDCKRYEAVTTRPVGFRASCGGCIDKKSASHIVFSPVAGIIGTRVLNVRL
jgi:hypothetical protein